VYTALKSIGSAIRDLGRPTGLATEFGPFGVRTKYTYTPQTDQDRLVVTEDLIGSAFVLAQTYIKGLPQQPSKACNILHVANYWKHRDEWDVTWTPKNPQQKVTIDAVRALGAVPPVKPGQLTALAENVLNRPFDIDALWTAIT
jgi:hypothetical protein